MENNKNTHPDTQTKVCKCCGRELPISQFARAGFGLRNTCNECMTNKRKDGRQKTVEIAELRRQLAEARSLRLRDFSPRELMLALKEFGYEGTPTYTERRTIDISCLV